MENTHFYDNKLEKTIKDLKDQIKRAHEISLDEKQNAFKILQKTLAVIFSPQEMSYLNRLIVEKDQNHDLLNNLFVDDLLYLCYEKIVLELNSEFVEEFKIQLRDLPDGFCVQGRTIRLLQILLAFRD